MTWYALVLTVAGPAVTLGMLRLSGRRALLPCSGRVRRLHHRRVIALVTAGWNLATVLGAPLGFWVGDAFGWRCTFWAIAALGVVILCAVAALVQPSASQQAVAHPHSEAWGVLRPPAALVLVIIVLAQAGLFTAYTFIAPL